MRIIDCEQGTPEWIRARLGRVTASGMDSLVTPTGRPSAGADKYLARLFAEWFTGAPVDDVSTPWMERGKALEDDARNWYAFEFNADVQRVGLCIRDDDLAACSPDSLVGDDGGLEIKTPGIVQHAQYLTGGFGRDHAIQVQASLWVTGRAWWTLMSWNPALPKVVERIERDEELMVRMESIVVPFIDRLNAAKAKYTDERAAYLARAQDEEEAALAEL